MRDSERPERAPGIKLAFAVLIAALLAIPLFTVYLLVYDRQSQSEVARASIAGLLIALYAVLYILLSLEAYSLLIGSLLLFAALASVMYLTRNLEWGGRDTASPSGD